MRRLISKYVFGRKSRSSTKIIDGHVVEADQDGEHIPEKPSTKDALPETNIEAAATADKTSEARPPTEDEPATAPAPIQSKNGRIPKIERFFIHLKAAGRGQRTIQEYQYEHHWWQKQAAKRGKTSYRLKTHEIEQIVAELHPETKARKLAAFRTYARWLLREGHPRIKVELDRLAPIKKPRRLPKDLGADQFIEHRERAKKWCADGKREGVHLGLMVMGGLRISEIKTAKINGKGVQVIGKGDKERFVPVPLWLIKALNMMARNGRGGWAIHRNSIWRGLARHGIRNPHSLRHTYASELLRRGRTIEEVQTLLGHEDISTTNIYARLHAPPDVVDDLER